MRRTVKGLQKRVNEARAWAGKLEEKLQDKCDFEIGIETFEGDGICIINVNTSDVAPIWVCIDVIESVGRLSLDDHKELCI